MAATSGKYSWPQAPHPGTNTHTHAHNLHVQAHTPSAQTYLEV